MFILSTTKQEQPTMSQHLTVRKRIELYTYWIRIRPDLSFKQFVSIVFSLDQNAKPIEVYSMPILTK